MYKKRDNKISVGQLIELLKNFPKDMPVNMDYDGWQYDYVYAANIQPVAYRPGEYREELFLLNYWVALRQFKNGKKVYFPKGNEFTDDDLQD